MDEKISNISPKPYNLEPNVEAALAYLITPITGIAVLLMEKNDRFVRFHAYQSVLFGFVAIIILALANSSFLFIFGSLLTSLLSTACFLYWLFLMWKAYNKEEYEIPFLGKIARDQLR